MNREHVELAQAIGVDPEYLQSAADAVGEDPLTFVRVAVRFRAGAVNPEEFAQYVEVDAE